MSAPIEEERQAEKDAAELVSDSRWRLSRRNPRAAEALDLAVRINWLEDRLALLRPRFNALVPDDLDPAPEPLTAKAEGRQP